ncbi:c-type cytochrome [Thiorhodococcus mannitoliphagus]|uniref:C-type cytochrome n=1 Tax=Thiorhodococcus mannitoliphagus TaxID=329406 RepID=A0A6P1DQ79_9GAMM|nr:c-type cytochrome [Thiorhodococcus mannitoliphagus]NEX19710.1 c-type cytochrome [Thiorhodococcus mannitoliphagus]
MFRLLSLSCALLALMQVPATIVLAAGQDVAAAEYAEAMALTPDVDNGRQVYLTCAVCHRPEGWGTIDGTYPQIAGQLQPVIVKQLTDIRAHRRENPLMLPFSGRRILGGTQQIADVSAYVAQLPMSPRNGVGPGIDLELGRQVYIDNCAGCHGAAGEGDSEEVVPAIAGQHYPYLVRQFEAIRTGRRNNANADIAEHVAQYRQRDAAAMLDYAARLRPPAAKMATEGWLNPDFPAYVREPMGLPPFPPAPPIPALP